MLRLLFKVSLTIGVSQSKTTIGTPMSQPTATVTMTTLASTTPPVTATTTVTTVTTAPSPGYDVGNDVVDGAHFVNEHTICIGYLLTEKFGVKLLLTASTVMTSFAQIHNYNLIAHSCRSCLLTRDIRPLLTTLSSRVSLHLLRRSRCGSTAFSATCLLQLARVRVPSLQLGGQSFCPLTSRRTSQHFLGSSLAAYRWRSVLIRSVKGPRPLLQ